MAFLTIKNPLWQNGFFWRELLLTPCNSRISIFIFPFLSKRKLRSIVLSLLPGFLFYWQYIIFHYNYIIFVTICSKIAISLRTPHDQPLRAVVVGVRRNVHLARALPLDPTKGGFAPFEPPAGKAGISRLSLQPIHPLTLLFYEWIKRG